MSLSSLKIQAVLTPEDKQIYQSVKRRIESELSQKISDGLAIRFILRNYVPKEEPTKKD